MLNVKFGWLEEVRKGIGECRISGSNLELNVFGCVEGEQEYMSLSQCRHSVD